MKKFFKYNYKKLICAITLVLLICTSVITSFAYFPSNGVSFQYDDLKSKFFANEYYYRYIVEAYNWNTNTTDGRVPMEGHFKDYYKFAWFPFRSTYGSNLKTDMETVLIQLAESIEFDVFSNIINYVDDYEIIAYYDIVYNVTKIVYIPTQADDFNYYIKSANFVCYTANANGLNLDGSQKQYCTLNAVGQSISNANKVVDAFIFTINSNASNFSYIKTDLSGTSVLFAPQNVLFCTSKVRQAILNKYNNDSSIFVNYYNSNGLNGIQFIDFNNIVQTPPIGDVNYNGQYMLGNVVSFEGAEFTVSLKFDIYFFGNTNIDFNRFFVSMEFMRNIYGQRNIFPNTYSATWTAYNYRIINKSIYTNPSNSADLNIYTIQVDLTASTTNFENMQKLNGHNEFDVVYFESLEWSTSLANNKTTFGYNLSSNGSDAGLNDLWTNLRGGIEFITYISDRLYVILPPQVYTFLVASLAIVVILGTIRLIIS